MSLILIIDDNENIRSMLKALLENEGYTVQTAVNGKEGIHFSKKIKFDLIVTDIYMPEKDGLETISEIRNINPNVKIITISGGSKLFNTIDCLEFASKMGADYTIKKPIDNKEFLENINNLISK